MFVLLEHDTRARARSDEPPSASEVHWDLLVELAGQERLATWQLSENPIGASGEVSAERIGDHRRAYLDREGEISGGRGRVRRVDRGKCVAVAHVGGTITLELEGAHLRGSFEIVPRDGDRACLRRAAGLHRGNPPS